MDRHIKTKKHKDNQLEAVSTTRKSEPSQQTNKDNAQEHGFAVSGSTLGGMGKNFFITFQKPVKYHIAKFLSRRMYTCSTCCLRFRLAGLLRRHKLDSKMHRYHLNQAKKITKYRIKWHRMVAKYLKLKNFKKLASTKLREQKKEKMNKVILRQKAVMMAVICNEFTDDRFPHSHSHMYLKTKNPKSFKDVKKFCRKALHTTANNIQRPLNFRETVRYITQTDAKAVVYNIPTKFCGTVRRAHEYSRAHSKVVWSDAIPSSIAACDRKVFESYVKAEKEANDNELVVLRTDREMLHWQKSLFQHINENNTPDRAVFLVVDTLGGCGKSFLAQKLIASKGALLLGNFNYKDNAYLYNGDPWVVFDIPRDTDMDTKYLKILRTVIL